MPKILAIDDDENFLLSIANLLRYKQYEVEAVSNPLQAEKVFQQQDFDCVLLDVKMPGMDGITLLKQLQNQKPLVPIIMISGQSNITTAVEAIKLGAYDFVEKPLEADRLLITIRNALEKRSWFTEKENLLAQIKEVFPLLGESPAMKEIFRLIRQVARSNAKVLITGETGTGKELVARAIHQQSARNGKPFVKLNCAAIPGELLESQLFGHKKGAFTGATRDQVGKFVAANGGTLFLDEIGDMEPRLQAKLLTTLEDGEVEVLGEPYPRKVDVRIISATNRNLPEMVEKGKFRADLYHRLKVVEIHVPPLRERREDIALLSRYFLQEFAQTYNKKLVDFTPQALNLLRQYSWPGNVRELRNLVEKIAIFTRDSRIEAQDVELALDQKSEQGVPISPAGPLEQALQDFERDYILRHLKMTGWKIQETANLLGIHRSALFRKIRRLGLEKG